MDKQNYLICGTPELSRVKEVVNAQESVKYSIKLTKSSDQYLDRLRREFGANCTVTSVSRTEFDMKELINARSTAYNDFHQVFSVLNNAGKVPVKWAVNEYKSSEIIRVFQKQVIEHLALWKKCVSWHAMCLMRSPFLYWLKNRSMKLLQFRRLYLNLSLALPL